ncbi:MAG: hypothetical protein ACI8PP_002386 [Candidatus Pseudothioglobus sp.]|jgi:hypothetical protein
MNINKRYQAERDLSARLPADVMRHSQLAMRAARRMRASSKKDRHGKLVCQHLLRMLACDTGHAGASTPRLTEALVVSLASSTKGHQSGVGSSKIDTRQYSLGF